ncbi:hypothetical protein GCM10010124_13000 [Pilimelia terevasa]|uniref:Secreted protein n=1 Tax=Pilimelia terevasa TaxID=53372 RepID=A0A8J3BKT1_9ACTN|nr:DUF4360 domain-containing protein [Pilimelia terevasa]GGK21900.1 hypothetical protein GCM10010124_13000 [Pilimelia terevasa]
MARTVRRALAGTALLLAGSPPVVTGSPPALAGAPPALAGSRPAAAAGPGGGAAAGVRPAAAPALGFRLAAAAGTGCPRRSAVRLTSYAPGTLLLRLPAAAVRAGARSGGTATARRDCRAQVAVTVPAGYRWRLDSIAAKGRAWLPAGATARAFVFTTEVGDVEGTVQVADLSGPYRRAWVGLFPPEKSDSSQCGAAAENLLVGLSTDVTVADPRRDDALLTLPASAADDFAVALGLTAHPCA